LTTHTRRERAAGLGSIVADPPISVGNELRTVSTFFFFLCAAEAFYAAEKNKRVGETAEGGRFAVPMQQPIAMLSAQPIAMLSALSFPASGSRCSYSLESPRHN
jgi:hypothetical protein